MSPEKAEILGLLCAEGSYYNYISNYWEYDKRRKKKYLRKNKRSEGIEFNNNDYALLNRFLKLLEKVYSYKRRVIGVEKSRKIVIKRQNVVIDILKYTLLYRLRINKKLETYKFIKTINSNKFKARAFAGVKIEY